MNNKLKLGILLLAIIASAALFLVPRRAKAESRLLTLTFQRYSDLDPYVRDVGFFWLTNASDKAFVLCMTGGSNTLVLETGFFYKKAKTSYMVNCAFSDQTNKGWTNWEQAPLPSRGQNTFMQLAPHSGMVIRAPLPTNGQKRKVAVVCEESTTAWRQTSLWNSGFGHDLLRVLPRWALLRLAQQQPTKIQVWCDQELSHPGEKGPQREPAEQNH